MCNGQEEAKDPCFCGAFVDSKPGGATITVSTEKVKLKGCGDELSLFRRCYKHAGSFEWEITTSSSAGVSHQITGISGRWSPCDAIQRNKNLSPAGIAVCAAVFDSGKIHDLVGRGVKSGFLVFPGTRFEKIDLSPMKRERLILVPVIRIVHLKGPVLSVTLFEHVLNQEDQVVFCL